MEFQIVIFPLYFKQNSFVNSLCKSADIFTI